MSEWDDVAAGWDDDEAVRAYAGGAYASLLDVAAEVGFALAGTRVCDFGCGTGLLTERLVEECGHIDAVDPSTAMLAVVHEKVGARGWANVRALAELPGEPQGYGLVVCSSVLAFVPDYAATVELLVRHLAPGGLLVQWDWAADPADPDGGGLTAQRIAETLAGAGLSDVGVRVGFEVEAYGQTMSPLMGFGRRPA